MSTAPAMKGKAARMRAIVFDPTARRNFTFGEAPALVPAAPNELVIDVKAFSLGFGEVATLDNVEKPGDVPGWDSAGVVVVAAPDGSGPAVGARVVGADWSSAWAEHRILRTDNVAVIPDGIDFEAAAALSIAGVTALQTVRALGSIVGRRVMITGASGGVGRLAVQLAAQAGAEVVAVVGSLKRGEGLRELGAHEVVVDLVGVAPVYGVIEHVGGPLLAKAFALLSDGGQVISVGAASGQPTVIDFEAARMSMLDKRIVPFMTSFPVGADLTEVLQFAAHGRLDPQIGYRDSWRDLDAAIDALLDRTVPGKAVLTVD